MLLRVVPARCAPLMEEGVRREADAALESPDAFYTDRELADTGVCVTCVFTPNDSLHEVVKSVMNAWKDMRREQQPKANRRTA